MSDFDPYVINVSNATIREIQKRKKTIGKNGNGETFNIKNSHFGYGTVCDTIPTVKKDLEDTRKELSKIIKDVQFPESYLEREPLRKKISYQKKHVDITIPSSSSNNNDNNKEPIPKILLDWKEECDKNIINGMIGQVPECYQDGMLPLEIFVATPAGQVVLNILKFLKNKIL